MDVRSRTLKKILYVTAIAATFMFTLTIGVATYLGYRWFTDTHLVSADDDGQTRAKVIRATLYARNDLRVGRLSGVVQGVGQASRVWGWLKSSQVVKAPFTVDYTVPLSQLKLGDFRYDRDREVMFVNAPEPVIEDANIDLANATLNDVGGLFVTRGAMAEMTKKTAFSARRVAADRAGQPETRAKVRDYARTALEHLFGGVLSATGQATRVEVRFPADPRRNDGEQWDRSRSLQEVLGNAI